MVCDYIFMAQLTDTYFQRGLLGALELTSPSQDTRILSSVALTLGINENVYGGAEFLQNHIDHHVILM